MATVAITGSGSGIGAAIRAALEARGDRVVGVDLRGAEIEADLSKPEGRAAAVDGIREHTRDGLDQLVICAGVGSHLEDLALIASVNYFGAIEVLDPLREDLAGRTNAAALLVCSNSARFGPFESHPFTEACLAGDEAKARELIAGENGFVAYSGSKHALGIALRRRAVEWGEARIRLNGIAPGPTETAVLEGTRGHAIFGRGLDGLTMPLGRTATPDEIARVAAFMLSPDASFVHGAIWYVDGGNEAATLPDRL